ncbi:MAG TPA: NB-ARC domain-containing protein [Vicinamibacterales bacterium]|nr:NB-ARC domain-containing protein [Vicinamibacterales bacterium]
MASDAVAFISYARDDGEQFAHDLRDRLTTEQPEITLWRDRERMEGGADWWLQIQQAIEKVSFLILVMTPASMKSEVVRREWRYARQQGVCVVPVKTDPKQDFSNAPGWMKSKHFFDLREEWDRFCLQLKSPCNSVRVPFMSDIPPANFVSRPAALNVLLSALVDERRENPKPGGVALYGAGGFGKTTLAKALCNDDDVHTAFDGGILWATLGEKPDLKRELTKMYQALTGAQSDFLDADHAAFNLSEKLADRRCLIVVDDVWEPAHLQPFMRGAKASARLITTRQLDIASMVSARVPTAQMELEEADAVLSWRLEGAEKLKAAVRAIVESLGAWPLLLELANAAMRLRVQQGASAADALNYVREALKRRGVVAFDRRNATERNQAIGNTIAVSLELLSPAEQLQYFSLGVFPEDADVPISSACTLWGLDEFDTGELLMRLGQLSLLRFDAGTKIVRLHDAMRAYLEGRLQHAPDLHARLTDTWVGFDQLTTDYARTHVLYHLAQSMRVADQKQLHVRTQQLAQLLDDDRFQEYQRRSGNPFSTRRDLTTALHAAVSDSDQSAPIAIAAIGVSLAALPREQLRPARLFELAGRGNLEAAAQLLSLIKMDIEWRDVALLTLAWLATESNSIEAIAVREEVAARASGLLTNSLLARWQGAPAGPLPQSPPLYAVESILNRMAGPGNVTGIEPLNLNSEVLNTDAAPAYLAELDAPMLVAFARQDPTVNTKYLKQYISIHGTNNYVFYRNRSLEVIAECVLRVPDVAWVKDLLIDVVTAAMGASDVEFSDCLPLTITAVRARSGDAEALGNLETFRVSVEEDVQALEAGRGNGDPWSFKLRRLTGLGEVYAVVLGRPADAQALLLRASKLPYGFAGFRAKACLALAEALRICGSEAGISPDSVLDSALAAAHNIQDPRFSARITAQVNAMTLRWHHRAFDPEVLASALVRNSASAELCAVHKVGEEYKFRASMNKIPMQDWLRNAASLRQIASIYECDENELLAVNAGKGLDDVLQAGSEANVPIPGFAPLLAALCAAEVLASPTMSDGGKARLIQRLIPVAANDLTAVDTVLARMIMAARAAQQEFPKSLLRLPLDASRLNNDSMTASVSVRGGVA